MRRLIWTTAALAAVAGAGAARVEAQTLPAGFSLAIVAEDLEFPTAAAFAPDGRILVAERFAGTVRSIEDGVLDPTPLLTVAGLATDGEQGLLGLAPHPDFAANGFLYVYYTQLSPFRNRVVRYVETGGAAVEDRVILDDIPANVFHNGGNVAFAPDGTLLIQTGDALVTANAQSLASLAGKMLRVNDDGTIPADNPFVGVGGARGEIFSYGHRNGFGFVPDRIDPTPLRVYVSENGPSGFFARDEVNLAVAGAEFGWPVPIAGSRDPLHAWPGPALVAPTGIARYDGAVYPPGFAGNLFVGRYNRRVNALPLGPTAIERIRLNATGDAELGSSRFLSGSESIGAPIDLLQGPDGRLYFTTVDVESIGVPVALYRIDFDVVAYLAGALGDAPDAGNTVGSAVATIRRDAGLS